MRVFLLVIALFVTPWSFAKDNENTSQVKIEMFMTTTCPHCQKADIFFKTFAADKPWLVIKRYYINTDKSALLLFNQRLKEHHAVDFEVPSLFFCKSRWVGFNATEALKQPVIQALEYCHTQLQKNGKLSSDTHTALVQMSLANWYKANLETFSSAYGFIPAMALMDALSSSALFTIMTLFAFLYIYRGRGLRAGILALFLMAGGFSHYFQQAHTILFYQGLKWLLVVSVLTGLLLLAFVYYTRFKHQKLSQGALLWVVILSAFTVQSYQQTHVPNFSLIFQQWVMSLNASSLKQIFYQSIFQMIYALCIGILATGITALAGYYAKWAHHEKMVADFVSGFLVLLASLLLFYPYYLGYSHSIYVVTVLALLFCWSRHQGWLGKSA